MVVAVKKMQAVALNMKLQPMHLTALLRIGYKNMVGYFRYFVKKAIPIHFYVIFKGIILIHFTPEQGIKAPEMYKRREKRL